MTPEFICDFDYRVNYRMFLICLSILLVLNSLVEVIDPVYAEPIKRVVFLVDNSGSTNLEARLRVIKQWAGSLLLDPAASTDKEYGEIELVLVTFSATPTTVFRGPVANMTESRLRELIAMSSTSDTYGTDIAGALVAASSYGSPNAVLTVFSDMRADDIRKDGALSKEVAKPFTDSDTPNPNFPWQVFEAFGSVYIAGVDGLDLVSQLESQPALANATVRADFGDSRPVLKLSDLVHETGMSANKPAVPSSMLLPLILVGCAMSVFAFTQMRGKRKEA